VLSSPENEQDPESNLKGSPRPKQGSMLGDRIGFEVEGDKAQGKDQL
jgi:hypothetical protein